MKTIQLVGIVLIIVVATGAYLMPNKRKAPYALTNHRLKNVVLAVGICDQGTNSAIIEQIFRLNSRSNNSTADAFFEILRQRSSAISVTADTIDEWKIDGWGNPFNVMISTNNSSHVLARRFANGSIVVWSNGPNQKSDHGTGDDITWPVQRIQ